MSAPVSPPPQAERPRRLLRSREDRVIGGVAGGVGAYVGIDPVIVRLVFVVLALAGGGGILAYIIAWIVIPEAPEDGAPVVERATSSTPMLAGLVLIALGGLLLVDQLLPAFSWRYVGPVLLILFGGLLLAQRATDR
ncbi:MAG: PspC domain-containing protein [Nitriliruptor sp.]|nr:MAG: PspC domain-containing protein [Nitriliruptor sp.]